MKLDRVQIKNFRSIRDIDLAFDPNCRVLVGINESGKSNILHALGLLRKNVAPVKKDDLREALPDEDPISESYVRFIFKFEKSDSDKLFENVCSKILASAKNPDIVSVHGKNENVREFCAARIEGLCTVNILEEEKSFRYRRLSSEYALLAGWKKPTPTCPKDFAIELQGQQYALSQFKLIREADFQDIPEGYLEDATIENLAEVTGAVIVATTKDGAPDTLFWEYDEANLLPLSLNAVSFAANPESCLPLKNMFTLAGIDDIGASLTEAKQGTKNQFQNYLDCGFSQSFTQGFS